MALANSSTATPAVAVPAHQSGSRHSVSFVGDQPPATKPAITAAMTATEPARRIEAFVSARFSSSRPQMSTCSVYAVAVDPAASPCFMWLAVLLRSLFRQADNAAATAPAVIAQAAGQRMRQRLDSMLYRIWQPWRCPPRWRL